MHDLSSIVAIGVGLVIGLVAVCSVMYLQRLAHAGVRPVGVALISMFQLMIGVLTSVAIVISIPAVLVRYDQLREELKPFAVTPEGLVGSVLIISVLAISGGIGLWRGAPWGWRIATFAIACGLVRNGLSLMLDRGLIDEFGQSLPTFYWQHLGRILLAMIMLIYLYRPRVLRFCSISMNRMAHVQSLFCSVFIAFGLEMLQRQLNR